MRLRFIIVQQSLYKMTDKNGLPDLFVCHFILIMFKEYQITNFNVIISKFLMFNSTLLSDEGSF